MRVLIPLNSGLVFVPYTVFRVKPEPVLIPLNSGLVFVQCAWPGQSPHLVLIPLNSGLVFVLIGDQVKQPAQVLIPLNSGLVFVRKRLTPSDYAKSLNPFEFRAGICSLNKSPKDKALGS